MRGLLLGGLLALIPSCGDDTPAGGDGVDLGDRDGAESDALDTAEELADDDLFDALPGPDLGRDAPSDGGGPDEGPSFDVADLPASGLWRTLDTLPPAGARQEHAVVALGRELYLIGGFLGSLQATTSVEAYDPGLDRWRRATAAPVAMHHPNAVADPGAERIWVLGHLGPSGFEESGDAFVYDTREDRWSPGPALPEGRERGGSGTVLWDGHVYVLGGLRGDRSVADVDRLDLDSLEWEPLDDLPGGPIDHAAAGVIDGVIYVAGGRRDGANTNLLFAYDIESATWSEERPMLTPRSGVAGAVSGGRLFVFGGEGNAADPVGIFDDTEVYDPVLARWQALAPMPTPRHGLGAASLNGRIYLPMGADEEGFAFVSAFEVFLPPPR